MKLNHSVLAAVCIQNDLSNRKIMVVEDFLEDIQSVMSTIKNNNWFKDNNVVFIFYLAGVAKLVDALDLGSMTLSAQVPPPVPFDEVFWTMTKIEEIKNRFRYEWNMTISNEINNFRKNIKIISKYKNSH